jgi:predicted RNA-binding protein with PIN domain/protein-tyrosine-phosphatase
MPAPADHDDRPEPEAAGGGEQPGGPELVLPEPVRTRIVEVAAGAMSGIPPGEIPPALRRVAKFAPQRRARLGGAAIAAQLATDAAFRQRIAGWAATEAGDAATALAAALAAGEVPAADPVEVAALAYLTRPAGWRNQITAAQQALRVEADSAAVVDRIAEAEARVARAEHDHAVARVEADKLRDELGRARDELVALRKENRRLNRSLQEAETGAQRARELLATEKGRASRAAADHEAELRRMRARLAETEQAVGAARAAAKDARAVNEARLWLLLETIGQAAVGLRRELALEPVERQPADFVADEHAERAGTERPREPARALGEDDPARLDQLLALPRVHLVVDGYNVTKRGFGDIPLEQQRNRLVKELSGLAAQTGAEVTVAFDGADRVHGLPAGPRTVRVLFSRKGQTADDLIRRLVRAEPDGRPVVVVSSDREVADSVRRSGAYPTSADALLRRLARS